MLFNKNNNILIEFKILTNKMFKSIEVDDFYSLKINRLLCLPYLSISCCNNQMVETVSSTSTSTSLGLLTGIVILGFTSYISFLVAKKLYNVIVSSGDTAASTTNPVKVVSNVTSTTNPEEVVSNLIHSIPNPPNNNYVLLGGQNYFNNIINTSHNIGFGKTIKHVIWFRRMSYNGRTNEDVLSNYNLDLNKMTTSILNTHDTSFTTSLFDIMPLIQGDRWITNPIPIINYVNMSGRLANHMQYNDAYIDILVFTNTNFKYSYLNSFFYLGIDHLNACYKLQEIVIAIKSNGL